MKRLFVSAICALALALICICGKEVVKSKTQKIEKGIKEIQASAVEGDIKKAKRLSRKLERDFVKDEKVLSLFVNSDTLSDLGMALSRVEPLLKGGASPEFYSELSCLKVQIIHIKSHS